LKEKPQSGGIGGASSVLDGMDGPPPNLDTNLTRVDWSNFRFEVSESQVCVRLGRVLPHHPLSAHPGLGKPAPASVHRATTTRDTRRPAGRDIKFNSYLYTRGLRGYKVQIYNSLHFTTQSAGRGTFSHVFSTEYDCWRGGACHGPRSVASQHARLVCSCALSPGGAAAQT
jgi:hypothetical protein